LIVNIEDELDSS